MHTRKGGFKTLFLKVDDLLRVRHVHCIVVPSMLQIEQILVCKAKLLHNAILVLDFCPPACVFTIHFHSIPKRSLSSRRSESRWWSSWRETWWWEASTESGWWGSYRTQLAYIIYSAQSKTYHLYLQSQELQGTLQMPVVHQCQPQGPT